LTFPEKAQPTETITHNLTITAYTSLQLENFTMIIKALVNSSWQQVHKEQIFMQDMLQDENLTRQMMFTLPQETHDRLYCFMYVLTGKTPGDPSSFTYYTTQVDTLTYDELLSEYNELLANYSSLLSDYQILLESYNNLSAQYSDLNSTYDLLLSQYNELLTDYNALNSTYYTQKANYDFLQINYNSLQTNYNLLNQSYTTLETETNDLLHKIVSSNSELALTRNFMYAFVASTLILVALILYIKKKKPEPYIVIRKETVKLAKDK